MNNLYNIKSIKFIVLELLWEKLQIEILLLPYLFFILLFGSIILFIKNYYQPYFLLMFDEAIRLIYEKLKIKEFLKADYILYTYENLKIKKTIYIIYYILKFCLY